MRPSRSSRGEVIPAPRTVDFLLTYECTSRCSYCFMGQRGTPLTMGLAVADRAVDWIALAAQGPVEVALLGGEPTLRPLLIRRVVRRAREWERRLPIRFAFSMTTNAMPLDDGLAERLAEWDIRYMISVGGYGERHDRSRPVPGVDSPFSLLQNSMPRLRRRQPEIAARVTSTPATVPYLAEDLAGLTAMGFTHLVVAPATGITWPEEELERFVAEATQFATSRGKRNGAPFPKVSPFDEPPAGGGFWGCGAGRGRYAIDPEGRIFACARFAGLTETDGLRLGDISRGVDPAGNLCTFLSSFGESRPSCRKCDLRDECQGGCPAVNLEHSGNLATPHPDECRFSRAIRDVRRLVSARN